MFDGAGALERRRDGEHHLRDYVECEARDLSGEPFTRFMAQLYKRIYGLIARCNQHLCPFCSAQLLVSGFSMRRRDKPNLSLGHACMHAVGTRWSGWVACSPWMS